MTRTSLAVVAAAFIVVAGIAPLVAGATADTATAPATDIQPGERLAGVVGVEGTDLRSDLEQRALGHRLAAANSTAAKARVVATEVDALEDRLAALRDRKATLTAALENGSITQGEYATRVATLIAAERGVTALLNRTAVAAAGLPAEVLAAHNVSVEAIQTLRENARNLTGAAVAAIAKEIAGPPANASTGNDRGSDAQVTAAITKAETAIAVAETKIAQATNRVEDGNDALESANDRLEEARETLAEARAAAADGNRQKAVTLAQEAAALAREAADLAQDARPTDDGETTTTSVP
ncbi:MAG: hypothetical protein ABEJ57_04045 [Halobacteriaceae archaeon]